MPEYNYNRPLTSAERTTIHNNRVRLALELKNNGVDPDLANYMPIPTTPMSGVEIRTMAMNTKILQEEAKWTFKVDGYKKYNSAQDEPSYYYGGGLPTLRERIYTWIVAFIVIAFPFVATLIFKIFD